MKKILLSLFLLATVLMVQAQVLPSTDTEMHWYTLNARLRTTNVVADNGALTGIANTRRANTMWKFVRRSDGSFDIVNRASNRYISPDGASFNNQLPLSSVRPSAGWTLKSAATSGMYIITSGSVQFNQTDAEYAFKVYNWGGGNNTSDNGCQFEVKEYIGEPAAPTLLPEFKAGYQTTGRSATAMLLRGRIEGDATTPMSPTAAYVTVSGAEYADSIMAYLTDSEEFYAQSLHPVARTAAAEKVTLDLSSVSTLEGKVYYLYLTAKIKEDAPFGSTIGLTADSMSCRVNGTLQKAEISGTTGAQSKIFATWSMPFVPTTNGSRFYRIPAIVRADDGSLFAVSDKRYGSNGDLGNHKIDVVGRRSTDGGKTWQQTMTIAEGDGRSTEMYGVGDPALVKTKSGKLVCLMAAGSASFWSGLTHVAMTTSTDNGQTWSTPQIITTPDRFTDNVTGRKGVGLFSFFVTSGRGLCTKEGRLMFLVDAYVKNGSPAQNYVLYSDDEGETWTLGGTLVYDGSNEAKLAQRPDGSILASIRQGGNRGFNIGSSDGTRWIGQTRNSTLWGANCNAEIITYDDEMMIHTMLNDNSRRNLRIYASADGGATWAERCIVQTGDAGYSSMERLADGSLGVIFEDASYSVNGYAITYVTIPAEEVQSWKTGLTGTQKPYSEMTQEQLSAWFEQGVGDLFGLNAETAEALRPKYESMLRQSSIDDFLNLRDSILAHVNYPETGYYRMENLLYPKTFMSYTTKLTGILNDTLSVPSVVKWIKVDEGKYTLSIQGQYVQSPTRSTLVTLGNTAATFTPLISTPGLVSMGTSGGYSYLHCDASRNIVGWTSGSTGAQASSWRVSPAQNVEISMFQAADSSYTTMYMPFGVTLPEGTEAYSVELSADGTQPALARLPRQLGEGTPALLVNTNGETKIKININTLQESSSPSANLLTGTYDGLGGSSVRLSLQQRSGKLGFWSSVGRPVEADKCYLSVVRLPQSMRTGFELNFGVATSIEKYGYERNDSPAYNLAGQKTDHRYKGIVVRKGKKVLQ